MPNLMCLRVCLVLAFGLFGGMAPSLAAEDVFTVSAVKVDVKAENAVAAREKAFAEAQSMAFRALAEKLLGEGEMEHYTLPDPSVISPMIKDFELTDERLSAVRYIGTYTFRFDGNAVRNHFDMRGKAYTDVASKPVLALPFFKVGQYTVLWQDPNPWMQAWSRQNHDTGLVPVTIPLGDSPDIADIGDNEALNYNSANLVTMLSRYNASEAVILIASPGPMDSTGVPSELQIMMYRTDRAVPEFVQLIKVVPDMNSTPDMLYAKAVMETKQAMQRDWKAQTAVSPTMGQSTVSLRAIFSTMQQWVETRQALRQVQGVSAVKIISVNPREAQVSIDFTGDENRLRLALSQADLILSEPAMDSVINIDGPKVYDVMLRKYAQPY